MLRVVFLREGRRRGFGEGMWSWFGKCACHLQEKSHDKTHLAANLCRASKTWSTKLCRTLLVPNRSL